MPFRKHLKRLDRAYYQGDAIVHWTMTVQDRKEGWLTGQFYYRFREILTHTLFRYSLASPMFVLMPDHVHMVWMGLSEQSDQLNAMKHFHPRVDECLERLGCQFQDQAHDHVFKDEERREGEFRNVCEYIARNPERAELVAPDGYASWKFTGCLVPGYPELRPFAPDYWERFDKTVSFLRKDGVSRV